MGPQQSLNPPVAGVAEVKKPGFASDADTTISEALTTLKKRAWVVILALLIGIGYGSYKAYSQPKVYSSFSIIQVRSGSSNEFKVSSTGGEYEDPGTKMNTEMAILRSDSLLTTVAKEMKLGDNSELFGAKGPIHLSLDDPAIHEAVVGTLQGGLNISLVPRTDMMRIGYVSSSPKMSADIVNHLVQDYIQHNFETRFESTRRVSQWLDGQLQDLKKHVEDDQEQLTELQRKLGMLGLDSTHNQLSTTLETLLAAEESANVQRITAESRYRMVAGMDPDTMEESIELTPGTAPGLLNSLRAQIAQLQANYDQLGSGGPQALGPNHPEMLRLRAEIAKLSQQRDLEQNRVLLQAKENYLAAKAAQDKVEQELETMKAEAYKQRDDQELFTLHEREFEQSRTLYEGLQQKLQTAVVQAGLDALEVDVVDPARPPMGPIAVSKSSIIISTSMFFAFGGVVLAFLLDSLDTGLHNIAEIEGLMELPSLAIIPRAKRVSADLTAAMSTAQRNINVLTQPKSQFTEAFRSLRTSLLLSAVGQQPKFILFTSATPSEGKTTTASNLACVLAQRDTRVLLIDADLRRPNIHHRFGLSGKTGLTTLLAGTTTLEDTLQHVPEIPNLDILPSGPVPPFPTEMLSSEAMVALLERVGHLYTHVVIDSPPILSVTDGVILARLTDAVVLVIRHGKSNKHILRRAHDLLARSGAHMAGIVLNAVDLNSPDYYGYYGYSGYSYASADSEGWESQATKAQPEGQAKR